MTSNKQIFALVLLQLILLQIGGEEGKTLIFTKKN
jgi:hypothetical protein